MEDLVKELTIDMVPDGDNRIIAETIGVENYYKLCSVVGGSTIYLQKPESVLSTTISFASDHGFRNAWIQDSDRPTGADMNQAPT